MDWYVIFVETGKEEIIKKWLEIYFNKNILKPFIFKKKITEKKDGTFFQTIKKVFPGYVFLNTNMTAEVYHKIKELPRYVKILNCGNHYSKLDFDEIDPILKIVDESFLLDYSQVLIENSKVTVKSGALYNKEEIIKKVDKRKRRAKIELKFMKDPKIIDVGIEIVNK